MRELVIAVAGGGRRAPPPPPPPGGGWRGAQRAPPRVDAIADLLERVLAAVRANAADPAIACLREPNGPTWSIGAHVDPADEERPVERGDDDRVVGCRKGNRHSCSRGM